MACVSPTLVCKNAKSFSVGCRHCASCIASRVAELSFVANLQLQQAYKDGFGASFVTLTYAPGNTPYVNNYKTLVKKDVQDFFKRLRKNLVSDGFTYPVKNVYCGEYGKKDGLPHYHSVIIGLDEYLAKKYVYNSWTKEKFGLTDIQTLHSSSGIRYVFKYMSKSNPYGHIKRIYDTTGVQAPFVIHSKGLGKDWIYSNADKIVKNGYCYRVPLGKRLYPAIVRNTVFSLTGVNPKPYVDNYLNIINTHGLSLDDFQAEQCYNRELDSYIRNIQSGSAAYLFYDRPRLPLSMRSKHNTDYKSIVDNILYDDKLPF